MKVNVYSIQGEVKEEIEDVKEKISGDDSEEDDNKE